jgi:hypothetical protein
LKAFQELVKTVREYLKIVRASRNRPDRRVNREGVAASRETTLLPAVLRQIAERRLHRVWVLDDEERGVKVKPLSYLFQGLHQFDGYSDDEERGVKV